jgi:hypothetical protein
MKRITEKSEKFRLKMNFGLDSGACRDAGSSHSLSLNELSHRAVFVLKTSLSMIPSLPMPSAGRRTSQYAVTRIEKATK